jgi:hypothetical protein
VRARLVKNFPSARRDSSDGREDVSVWQDDERFFVKIRED